MAKKLDEIMMTTIPDCHFRIQYGLTNQEVQKIPNRVIDRTSSTSVGENIAFESKENLKRRKIKILFQKMVTPKCCQPIIIVEKDGIGILGISSSVTTKQHQDEINNVFMKHYQHWKAIIIDMRGNGGGDSGTTDTIVKTIYGNPTPYAKTIQWRNTPEAKYVLISRIAKQYKDEVDYKREHDRVNKIYTEAHQNKMIDRTPPTYAFNPKKGFNKPIYILIDRHTMSSGEGILTQLRGHPFMTSIGEYSGGCGQYGNMGIVSLPNDIMLRLGTDYRTYDDGKIEGVGHKPDVLCSEKDAMLVCLDLVLKKGIDLKGLSAVYQVRCLAPKDIPNILKLCKTNPYYYKHCPPRPTVDTIKKDMLALPPKTTKKDKKYVGFFKGNELIALMDLILNYPDDKTCFIGLFMMNKKYQNRGIGSEIVRNSLVYLKKFYEKVRLGYVSTNEQSKNFWLKNGFKETGKEYKQPKYLVKVMEQELK